MLGFATSSVVSRRGRRSTRCCTVKDEQTSTATPATPSAPATPPTPLDANELRARIEQRVRAEGVQLDDLFNPAKVLDLEAKLEIDGATMDENERKNIERVLIEEKRSVIKNWLRDLFWIQGWGSAVLGGIMASNNLPFIDLPLGGRVLGFWLVWLFTIPALRARKPAKWEKSALNVAFLAVIVTNVGSPFVTKDPTTIWALNMVVMAACYAIYYKKSFEDGQVAPSPRISGMLRWLDWGSWKN